MTLTLTILGCGSSAGVPRPALGWGACDPNNPKNRRRRCSLLVERTSEQGTTRIVIDTSPDLREQLIDANVDHIDAVFLTHEHADQTHGIDDLRSVVLHQRRRIPVYLNQSTAKDIMSRFSYCFVSPHGSDYPPILDQHSIEAGESRSIDGKGGPVTLSAVPRPARQHPGARLSHRRCRLHARRQRHPGRELARISKISNSGSSTACAMPAIPAISASTTRCPGSSASSRNAPSSPTCIPTSTTRCCGRACRQGVIPAYDGMRLTLERAGVKPINCRRRRFDDLPCSLKSRPGRWPSGDQYLNLAASLRPDARRDGRLPVHRSLQQPDPRTICCCPIRSGRTRAR